MQHVETIWEGDVADVSRAYDLICIVDQVHDYAVNQHREYLMKHLEAWHARHEKSLIPTKPPRSTLNAAVPLQEEKGAGATDLQQDVSDDEEDEDDPFWNIFSKTLIGTPEWLRLKEGSIMTRQDMARQTRQQNKRLHQAVQPQNVDASSSTTTKKRGSGRPPKKGPGKGKVTKRQTGRPPKTRSKSTD